VLSHWWPALGINPASFVVVGMAGFFAAAAKTPFSTIVIVSEMTGGYTLLLPALWVCLLSFILSDEQSIYTAQVESRSVSPAHQGNLVRAVLAGITVRQFIKSGGPLVLLRPHDSLDTVLNRMNGAGDTVLPVVDQEQRLIGVVNLLEVHFASQSPDLQRLILAEDLLRGDVIPLQPDDPLDRAQELFVENDLLALPIVSNLESRRVIGMMRRYDISNAYLRRLQGSIPTNPPAATD
jgi:CIC family chloride channel protein